MVSRAICAAIAILLAAGVLAAPASSLRRENHVYFGIYNYAGQKVVFWIFFRKRRPDGRGIWDWSAMCRTTGSPPS